MTLGFGFHPEARAELVAGVDWYDDREVGVGERFEIAVRAAIDAAVDTPESWAVWPGWDRRPVVRSKGVSDFPYRVVYFLQGDVLMVVAVAHGSAVPAIGASELPRPELAVALPGLRRPSRKLPRGFCPRPLARGARRCSTSSWPMRGPWPAAR